MAHPLRPPTRLPGVALVVIVSALLIPSWPGGALGATSGEPSASVPSPVVPGGPPAPVGVWPLLPGPAVVAGFDPPSDPYGAGHRGVDLLGRPGQQVRAAMAGVVRYAGRIAGRGVVVVDHGDTRTTYEPVSASVAVGEPVASGAMIGTLEAGGSHCAPRTCLHWGWIRGETYLDPLTLVGAGPVRLLPLWGEVPTTVARLPYSGWTPMVQPSP